MLTFHIFIGMLIFLDIDGVMVPMAGWKLPENGEDGFPVFSKKATEALNTLISIDTKIILTTSHRDRFTLDQWQTIFEKRGLPIKNITRLESNTNFSKKRKDEILEWFENNQANDFIIIDDDKTLNSLPYHLKSKLILTSSMIGLTPDDLDQVLRTHH